MTHQYLYRRALIAAAAVLAAAPLAAVAAGSAQAAPPPSSGCAQVQLLVVRGTGEASPVGAGLTPLVNLLTSGAPETVSTYGVPYPATADWTTSVPAGVNLLGARIAESAAACPAQRFVLLGYSQGAWVVGDALSGTSPAAAALSPKIAAVVLYGDPRFVAGEPFDAGTWKSGVNGVYPRAAGDLATYASRIRSYCDAGDEFCQQGATGTDHGAYPFTKTTDAAQFVAARLGAAAVPVTSPTAGAPASSPTAPAPTATTAPTTTPTTTAPTTAPTTTAPSTTPPTTSPTKPARPHGGLQALLLRWFPWLADFFAKR